MIPMTWMNGRAAPESLGRMKLNGNGEPALTASRPRNGFPAATNPARPFARGRSAPQRSRGRFRPEGSVLVQVLLRNVILRNFPRLHFAFIRIRRVLDAADDPGLEGLAFLDGLFHALRIGELGTGQPLNVARLAAGFGAEPSMEYRFADASVGSNAAG